MKKRIMRFAAAFLMMTAALPVVASIEDSENSSAFSVYAAEKLAAPSDFKASQKTETTITLTWKKVKGASAYRVFMYNSESDEYESYKTVTDTTCTVKFLTAGKKYKFKVAALTKSGEKYSIQTKSSPITVTTKSKSSSSSSSSSPKPSQKPGNFVVPSTGDNSKKVLKECGIGNYTNADLSSSEGKSYVGTTYYGNIESTIYLSFNKKDQLYGYALIIPMSYNSYSSTVKSLKSSFGYDYELDYTDDGDLRYTWSVGTSFVGISYSYSNDEAMLVVLDFYYDDNY